MVRKNIFELLAEKYDIDGEFQVILNLFNGNILIYSTMNETPISIERAIDDTCFYSWKQRGSCLNLKFMRERLGLNKCDTSKFDNKISCLEYMCNIINLANVKLSFPIYRKTKEFVMLEQNIELLLEHLNYEKIFFEDEEKVILVPKSPEATAVAELASPEIAMAILKYHHASLKGKLDEKRKILLSIANEYEPLLANPIGGFTDYYTKATNMLNNFHIRHNNKSGKNKKEFITNMKDEELEHWYDELYQLLLFCVLIKDNKKRKEQIDELLKKMIANMPSK